MGMIVVGFFPDEFFHEVAFGMAAFVLRAHDCAFEAESEANGYSFHKGFGEGFLEAFVVEFCEEAERAEGE